MSNNVQQWVNLVLSSDAAGSLPAFGPGAVLSVPSSSGTYVNGMADPVAGGFVSLEAAEAVRAKALALKDPFMTTWANNVLPHKFAIMAATTDDNLGLSDDDKFSVVVNCGHANMSLWHGVKTWWPQGVIAKRDPNNSKHAISGPVIPGYAAFGPSVTIADLPAIFDSAFTEAQENAKVQGGIHFGGESGVI